MEKQDSTTDLDATQTQHEETLTSKDINEENGEQLPVEQAAPANNVQPNVQMGESSQMETETTISQAFPQQITSENENATVSQQTDVEEENTETLEIEDDSINKSDSNNDKILLPHEDLSSADSVSEEVPEHQENEETSTLEDKATAEEIDYYPSWNKVELPPTLMLGNLQSFYEDLQQYRGKRVQIIGESVQKIDTASLQLLLAFINSPEITVCWHNYSTTLQEAADLLGLTTELGLPDPIQCIAETAD